MQISCPVVNFGCLCGSWLWGELSASMHRVSALLNNHVASAHWCLLAFDWGFILVLAETLGQLMLSGTSGMGISQ